MIQYQNITPPTANPMSILFIFIVIAAQDFRPIEEALSLLDHAEDTVNMDLERVCNPKTNEIMG